VELTPVIPAAQEAETGDWEDCGSRPAQGKGKQDPISISKPDVTATPVVPASQGAEGEGSPSEAGPQAKM
jgi:hypothetical protein